MHTLFAQSLMHTRIAFNLVHYQSVVFHLVASPICPQLSALAYLASQEKYWDNFYGPEGTLYLGWGRNTIEIQRSSTSSSSISSSSISVILLSTTAAISYSFTLSVIFHITFFCLNSCTLLFIGYFKLGISDSFTDIFSYCKGKCNLLTANVFESGPMPTQ